MKEDNIIIGLECHLSLNKIKTKLFCSCALPKEDAQPNTYVCPTCLGMPGSKPVINKNAIDSGLKLALALNCNIQPELIFSRKGYFYPDLPKNFQITQYEIPLAKEGFIQLDSGKKIRLIRIHLEEDPGALIHEASYVLVDYNRSGIPLCEIVTEPEINSPEEAREFLNKLLAIVNYLGIYEPLTGVIKADANINIKGYERVEIKNITGFKEIERALTYEIERQKRLIQEGKGIKQRETRGWDPDKGITFFQRSKETEVDYGYIIEPDLVPIELGKKWIEKIKKELPELAHEKVERFIKQYSLDKDDAKIIAADPLIAKMFESVAKRINPVLAAHWIRRELLRVLNYNKKEIYETEINEKHLIDLLKLIESKKITNRIGQKIIEKLVEKPVDVNEYIKEESLEAVSDISELKGLCEEALKENKKAVEDYKKGEEKALMFIVGAVIRKSKGKATPSEVNKILKDLIK